MDAFSIVQLVLRIILAAVFVFMGIAHFVPRAQRTMAAMIPDALAGEGRRHAVALVVASGIVEVAAGAALLTPWWGVRFAAGMVLIARLVAVFPANVVAARDPRRFGPVAVPLVPRAIGQAVLGLLVLVSVI